MAMDPSLVHSLGGGCGNFRRQWIFDKFGKEMEDALAHIRANLRQNSAILAQQCVKTKDSTVCLMLVTADVKTNHRLQKPSFKEEAIKPTFIRSDIKISRRV